MTWVSGRKLALGAVMIGLGATAAGCTATQNQRGYMESPGMLEAIRVGVDTKQSLQAALGSPSTLSTFSDNTWYYISMKQEDLLFFEPEETDRKIVAVNFGAGDVVSRAA